MLKHHTGYHGYRYIKDNFYNYQDLAFIRIIYIWFKEMVAPIHFPDWHFTCPRLSGNGICHALDIVLVHHALWGHFQSYTYITSQAPLCFPHTITSEHLVYKYRLHSFKINPSEYAPRPRLNIKTVFPRYGVSHVKDKAVVRPSYLWHGDPYTGKTTSLYWDSRLMSIAFGQ